MTHWLPDRSRARAVVVAHPARSLAVVFAVAAGLSVFVIAHELFPVHSANHDEGVYLQQAAMLLEGQLFLTPGSEPLRRAFHPWFFVEGNQGLYPKYSPVPAAIFALGKLAGGYRLALAGVAALNVVLAYTLVTAAFDHRTGILAAVITAGAPQFLVTSAVFLPYAPTTALNLLFAVAYVRSTRRSNRRYAVLAGVAIGLAFFARPFTAMLFALPFVAHAAWRLSRPSTPRAEVLRRTGLTAGIGLGFVGVTLAYNAAVTGSALLFPYEAFAALDGVGFGRRAILGHEVLYTPELAVRANALVVWAFLTEWFTAGWLGSATAVGGMGLVLAGLFHDGLEDAPPLSDGQLQVVLLGVMASVVLGNVAFWGNLNILADLSIPGDGLISTVGPIYHFDLLVPMAAFAAHGTVRAGTAVRGYVARVGSARTLRLASLLLLAVSVPAVGAAEADALGPALARNDAYTAKYEQAYAPFRSGDLTNALVFLPATYGEWRNHPFQWLRNDPGFDGPAVYALARNPADDFAVIEAYPERTYYRYRYRGVWTPDPTRQVVPVLEPLRLIDGRGLRARTSVAVPDRIIGVTVAVRADGSVRRFALDGPIPDRLTLAWTLSPDGVEVDHPALTASPSADTGPIPIDDPSSVELTITLTEPSGSSLTYREVALVRPNNGGVQVLWPPASSTCPLLTRCGFSGTYLPDRPDTRPAGIEMNTTLLEMRP